VALGYKKEAPLKFKGASLFFFLLILV